MDTMQFRDFIFPHNPRSITVSGGTALATHQCPGRGEVVQDLGPKGVEVRCEGCFFADTPREAFHTLSSFRSRCEGMTGILVIPGMQSVRARLRDFAYHAQGDGRVVYYTMVFQEGI